jgi:hypothetical protein
VSLNVFLFRHLEWWKYWSHNYDRAVNPFHNVNTQVCIGLCCVCVVSQVTFVLKHDSVRVKISFVWLFELIFVVSRRCMNINLESQFVPISVCMFIKFSLEIPTGKLIFCCRQNNLCCIFNSYIKQWHVSTCVCHLQLIYIV